MVMLLTFTAKAQGKLCTKNFIRVLLFKPRKEGGDNRVT